MSKKLLYSVMAASAIVAATAQTTPTLPTIPGLENLPIDFIPLLEGGQAVLDALGGVVDAVNGLNPLHGLQIYVGNKAMVDSIEQELDITTLVANGSLRPAFRWVDVQVNPNPFNLLDFITNGASIESVVDFGPTGCVFTCEGPEATAVSMPRNVVCAIDDGETIIADCSTMIGPALAAYNALADLISAVDFTPELCGLLGATCGEPVALCSNTGRTPSPTELFSIYARISVSDGLDWGYSFGPQTECSGAAATCSQPSSMMCLQNNAVPQISNGQFCARPVQLTVPLIDQSIPLGYGVTSPTDCPDTPITTLDWNVGCPGLATQISARCDPQYLQEPYSEPIIQQLSNTPTDSTGGSTGGCGCTSSTCQKIDISDVTAEADVTILVNSQPLDIEGSIQDAIQDGLGQLTGVITNPGNILDPITGAVGL